jgi:hypothetical protein
MSIEYPDIKRIVRLLRWEDDVSYLRRDYHRNGIKFYDKKGQGYIRKGVKHYDAK